MPKGKKNYSYRNPPASALKGVSIPKSPNKVTMEKIVKSTAKKE